MTGGRNRRETEEQGERGRVRIVSTRRTAAIDSWGQRKRKER